MDQFKLEDDVAKEIGSTEFQTGSSIPSSPFSRIKREISEEDLELPAVKRLLLGEVDKLQYQVEKLKIIEKQFYAADKQCAILEEKIKSLGSHEVLYGFCLTVGSAIIGLTPLFWEDGYGLVTIIVGVFLVLGAVLSKVIKWK